MKSPKQSWNIVIFTTSYALMSYLLYASEKEIKRSCFVYDTDGTDTYASLPAKIRLNKFKLPGSRVGWRIVSLLYILIIRILMKTIWRKYFQNCTIYAQDHIWFSSVFIGKQYYTMLPDAFNLFSCLNTDQGFLQAYNYKDDTLLKKIITLISGPLRNKVFGTSPQCRQIIHENPNPHPYARHKFNFIKLDFFNAWQEASTAKRQMILNIFGVQNEMINNLQSSTILVLLGPFKHCISAQEEAELYKPFWQDADEQQVLFKCHPNGKSNDLKTYFPRATFLQTQIPIQLLILCSKTKFKKVITIGSTGLSLFDTSTEKIWLGGKCHPNILQQYGPLNYEEVCVTPNNQ